MIPVKICGITNLEDAQAAVNFGASALGFLFYNQSPRYIQPETAHQITADLKGQVSFVGVFVDQTLDYIHTVADQVGLNFVQLHGNESSKYCHQVQLPIIKVFRVSSEFDAEIIKNYDVHAFLFDTHKKNKLGGTGEAFNWHVIDGLKTNTPIILSGGLSIDNIHNGINTVLPSAVDVNSSVESKPGVKDNTKMKALFDILKHRRSLDNPFKISVFQGGDHEL